MPPVGFEPTISAGERPKNYALDRAATGTGQQKEYNIKNAAIIWNEGQQANNLINSYETVFTYHFEECHLQNGRHNYRMLVFI